MARHSSNSILNSLRGKIWVSTGVLAFFTCTFGLISYLMVSLLVNDVFYGVFIPFLLLAFVIMIFGWWLSGEVVNPIENVTLLAKSMERSTSTSIPRTSGSSETDQLLQTIQRNNQQFQKIVLLMENVANGNLDVKPLQGSDRLSTSFQKLLAKVSESINAKSELDELKTSLNTLKMDVSSVRSGNLAVEIRNESALTNELADTFKYLIDNLARVISAIQISSSSTEAAVKHVDGEIQTLVQRDEVRVQEMTKASIRLKQVPNLINKITDDLMSSAKSARNTIQKAQHGNEIAIENSKTVGSLRKQVREDVKRIQSLNERSHDIERVAKTVEDLANRTNMIALNASIQATELGENGHGFVLVAEEVERLAARANGTNKQISTLNKSILAEIKKVEGSAESTMAEVANLSKFAIESGNILGEMERYVSQFLNLQENLIAYSKDQSEETDNAFLTFEDSISETEVTVSTLKESGLELNLVAKAMKELKSLTGEFRVRDEDPAPVVENAPEENSHFEERPDDALYEEFASKEFDPDSTVEAADETVFTESEEAASYLSESSVDGESAEAQSDESESHDDYDVSYDSANDESIEFYAEETQLESDSSDDENLDLSSPGLSENDSVDFEDKIVADSYGIEGEDGSEFPSDGFESDEFSNLALSMDSDPAQHDLPEAESGEPGVLDLYDASLNAEDTVGAFDSGEYSVDELIDTTDTLEIPVDAADSAPDLLTIDDEILDDFPSQFRNPVSSDDPEKTLPV